MRKIIFTIISIYLICYSVSCKKKEKDECPACPKVNSLAPANGKKGDTILINGKNFSSVLSANIVSFNGILVSPSAMISGSTTQLKVLVPAKCGTGPVEVKLDDELFSEGGPIFTYQSETVVSVFAGSSTGIAGNTITGTTFANTRFKGPSQIATDALNNVYVLDTGNVKVAKLDVSSGLTTVFLDNTSQINNPTALAVDENNVVYVSNYLASGSSQSTIYRYTPGSSSPTVYAADLQPGRKHVSLSPEGNGKFYVGRVATNMLPSFPEMAHYTLSNGFERFSDDAVGNVLAYKNESVYAISHIISKNLYLTELTKYNVKDTSKTVLINNAGGLNMSLGLVVDGAGNVYISDTNNNRIIKYSSTGVISTVVAAGLNKPQGIAMDKLGNIYVADTGNHCIKKISFD